MPSDIKSITAEELADALERWAQPRYRAGQVLDWLYSRRVSRWDAMTNLPKALRQKLSEAFTLETLEVVRRLGARDTTQKFLWRLGDGAFIESVLIPANPALYGEASDRHTLCVSTQVGCAYGCKFCASGLDGWKRNLHPHEIVEQVLAVEREDEAGRQKSEVRGQSTNGSNAAIEAAGEPGGGHSATVTQSPTAEPTPGSALRLSRLVDNVVVMGMGEPLANYDNLLKALRVLNAPWGGGIGARKMTISTSGLAPQIRKLAEEPEQFRLAVSLHGATDEVRNKLMPINRRFPLQELTGALEHYLSRKGRMLTFEYILIAGVNDSLAQTRPLAALARRLRAKVNLIPYNHVEGLEWVRPEDAACERFLAALEKQKVNATLRREKGHDIDAACGQLRLTTERALARGPG